MGRFEKVEVTADGKGLAGHAGSALLVAVADKVGLTKPCRLTVSLHREIVAVHSAAPVGNRRPAPT
jgi:hypothetical protein